jgi:membrane associated rhomboid family serine protease
MRNLPIEECYFDTEECFKNNDVVKNCTSVQDKLFSRYGISTSDISLSRPYTLITNMFVHANFDHIFYNMLFLLIVGAFVESRIKVKKFLILYFVSGIIASISLILFYSALGKSAVGLGASGAISGLFGANLILDYYKKRNEETAMIFGHLASYGLSVGFLIIFFIQQFFLSIIATNSGVGYVAHVAGFITGFVLIFFLKDKDEEYTYW